MKLATKTIKGLAKLVTGDAGLTPYKSGPALVEFFNVYGGNDVIRVEAAFRPVGNMRRQNYSS